MRKNASLVLLFVFVVFAAAGCQRLSQRTAGRPYLADEEMVSIYYLAGKLGMTVSQETNKKIVLSNTINTVAIYPKLDQIYVNNDYLEPVGKIKKIDGLIHIRSSVEAEIQSKLIKPAVEKQVEAAPKSQLPGQSSWKSAGKTIVIDAGHGGKDPGAISTHGFYEKTVNLDVALQVTQILRDKGYKVIMTRDSDKFIELEERAAIANRSRADIFVSIHADSCATSSKNGFTLYVARNASWASKSLAGSIDKQMLQTGIKSRGTRKADFRVLKYTRCPAVLVELGYLSNYWEAKQLKNKDMQKRLANAIACGITDYFKNR
ncbi:MAG: N-acetylmuramoyl-L-alanine amidase [Planctomycetes bacterium]|nr:N-acetylmuramoyl-L-alanine amidase [Planctomycetota bacterium]MBU1518915.1 N-acetylmuramoyl-L-alanine amidase [Planctomycetota bacterium]MBU2457524.1 N-acetylmuramoyl-L-alanine amidase [Planctomycetota bacterium]